MKFVLTLLLFCGLAYGTESPSIKLTWTQSISPNIAFNSVYRSVNGGKPALLYVTNEPVVTYIDTNVESGYKYCYSVTATNTDGTQSKNSVVVCKEFFERGHISNPLESRGFQFRLTEVGLEQFPKGPLSWYIVWTECQKDFIPVHYVDSTTVNYITREQLFDGFSQQDVALMKQEIEHDGNTSAIDGR